MRNLAPRKLPESHIFQSSRNSLILVLFFDALNRCADYEQLAREFKAFCRARKVKTSAELMRVVMSYCGLDQVLREVAGTFTLLEEAISDTAIHKRL